jgi:predicted amidophosphoribosyltransferase
LVHRLKYEGVLSAGRLLAAEGMAHLVPHDATALVPIPRTKWRAIRYGVDPAVVLADRLAELTGVPVAPSLRPSLYGRRHAGRVVGQRHVPVFALAVPPPPRSVLVDDVLTTGITLESAAHVLGGRATAAITATVSV